MTMRRFTLILALVATALTMSASEACPPTPAGTTELKTLPAGVLLKSAGRGNYFDGADNLFGPLFRYISRHDIAMTTPVEARIDDAAMYFWVAASQEAKVAGPDGAVVVERVAERRVASRGGRGSYSRMNYEKTRDELLAWLEGRSGLKLAGAPYAVFWHGPFTPWFAKRYEVHVPVRTAP